MELMSGNEAIAQGAWEAGCTIGVAYPGTPSTETLEAFAKKEGVYAEWCVNEKVAVEVGIGASAAGARVLATMKHVGVNVAADPLFTAAYTGVGGGILTGGGVSAQQELLIDPLAEKVRASVMPAFAEGLELKSAALQNDAGLVGAVYYFKKHHD